MILKYISLSSTFFLSAILSSRSQDTIKNAIIRIQIENISATENSPSSQTENQGFTRMIDGDIQSTIWMKNGLSKTEADLGFGKSVVYYNSLNKTTTTLFELMGKKMGFYSNEEELNKMLRETDSASIQRNAFNKQDVLIEYLNEEKTVAGIKCKKAIIHYQNRRLEDQQQEVWYCPEFILEQGIRFNELIRSASIPGLKKLKGFPMEMEIKRQNGSITKFEVQKIELNADIKDQEFIIPSGYDIRPMSEMNQGGKGRFQFPFENN